MVRLGNVTSTPSESHPRLLTHPFASNPPSQGKSLSYWSYFVDPDPRITTWERVKAGGAPGVIGAAVAAAPLATAAALLLWGCGGRPVSGGAVGAPDGTAAARTEGFLRVIESESYAGRLIVFFKNSEVSSGVRELLELYPDVELERSTARSPAEETRRRLQMEVRTGRRFLDWNRVYYLKARDKEQARDLQLALMREPQVSLVYPEQVKHGPTLETTPNLEGLQTYLEGPASAGLNVMYAWDQGVYGAGVMVADSDNGLNFDHEEFDLARRSPSSGGNSWGVYCRPDTVDDPEVFWCDTEAVAHGTATAGILHADHGPEDDRHGVRGIVPDAWMTMGSPLPDYNRLANGSIFLGECANQYSWDGTVTCNEGASGLACVPCVDEPLTYANIREAVTLGDITMILTAGNGAIDLDEVQLIDDETMEEICGGPATDPAAADCWETSGAILVGANQGDRDMAGTQPRKQSYSNCGAEVELNGWGERVVTTSWHPASGPLSNYEWNTVEGGPNPPNDDVNAYFINEFGGTSAAAAMAAGAATLVQSYFKEISGGVPPSPGSPLLTRYLLPWKMKEILTDSGVEANAGDGCGIGKQPNLEQALQLTEDFWVNEVAPSFPELSGSAPLTLARWEELRALGMGIEDGDPLFPPEATACPADRESRDMPEECITRDVIPHLSKKMDVDEDGRGDLISWTRGQWRIDLSSGEPADPECGTEGEPPCPEPNDNYGAWDITLNYPPVSQWEVPVVMDYDSDGQADLAIYDRENGQWKIALMSAAMLGGEWNGWTHTIDWPGVGDNSDYDDIWYTRPLPADYNGDEWTDLAVQTSDGHWKIAFDWRDSADGWAGRRFEEYGPLIPSYANSSGIQDLAYLTPAELAAYPGWAYLPVAGFGLTSAYLVWRGPDGIVKSLSSSGSIRFDFSDFGAEPLGGIENHPIVGDYGSGSEDIGVKTHDGFWRYYSSGGELLEPEPNGLFGNGDCKPLAANLDGGEDDDRTVMCADEWRIVYSGSVFASQNDEDGVRRVPLGYTNPAALPGCPVFGGLSYERVEQVRDYMYNLGLENIPPLFDYAMTPYEYCDLPWFVSDMPAECR